MASKFQKFRGVVLHMAVLSVSRVWYLVTVTILLNTFEVSFALRFS